MHLYTDTDKLTTGFRLKISHFFSFRQDYHYPYHWWNAICYIWFKRSSPIDYWKFFRLRIHNLINELQYIKHNSLHHDSYIFYLHHIFSFQHNLHVLNIHKLYIFQKALLHRLWECLPNEETLKIFYEIKRHNYVTLTPLWKCRLFTTFVCSGRIFPYLLTKN